MNRETRPLRPLVVDYDGEYDALDRQVQELAARRRRLGQETLQVQERLNWSRENARYPGRTGSAPGPLRQEQQQRLRQELADKQAERERVLAELHAVTTRRDAIKGQRAASVTHRLATRKLDPEAPWQMLSECLAIFLSLLADEVELHPEELDVLEGLALALPAHHPAAQEACLVLLRAITGARLAPPGPEPES